MYPLSEGGGVTSAEQPVWSGHRLRGDVCFDWDSMQARVEVIHPYLRVALSGKWVFYKAGSDVPEVSETRSGSVAFLNFIFCFCFCRLE